MYDVITYKLERTCNNMKKAIFDVISNGLAEYVGEEAEAEAEAKAEEAKVKAEVDQEWNQHEPIWVRDFNEAVRERDAKINEIKQQNEEIENLRSADEEMMRIKGMFIGKARGNKRRKAEAKAKRNSVEVAIIACRAFDKSAKHDMHWSYTLRSMSKSIRGNHGVFKSRTGKASRLIKRAEKVTGGGFDYNEFY